MGAYAWEALDAYLVRNQRREGCGAGAMGTPVSEAEVPVQHKVLR